MKQKIYEIPIWDSFQIQNCECPLCSIEKKVDDDFIESLFSEMVMDVRLNPQLVKDYDFCHEHFEKLYRYPDKCGLATLTNRILYTRIESLKKVQPQKTPNKKITLKKLFSKEETSSNKKDCLLCSRLNNTMDNYIETLLILWDKDEKFRNMYSLSKGFCIHHYDTIMALSDIIIKNKENADKFKDITQKLQEQNLVRLKEELEWFISKFDYRFANEPWKTSKDSLARTLQKLIGNYNTKI